MSLRNVVGAALDHAVNVPSSSSVQEHLSPLNSPRAAYYDMSIDVISVQSDGGKTERLSPGTVRSDEASALEFDPNALRYARSLMLRFDLEGNATFQEMSRVDVLRMTQEAATAPLGSDERGRLQVARLERAKSMANLNGGAQPFGTVIDVQRVHARDIRKLDNAFSLSNEPTIELRNQAILVNADPVRAIIMRHCCLVFVPDGADSLLILLQDMFREAMHQDLCDVPFEFKALEALLGTLSRYFKANYDNTAPMISSALDRLASGKMSVDELEALREFKNTMHEFESHLDGVRRALVEILDNEEDLRLLYLTKLHEDPSLLQDLWSFDSEEAEVLIENYLQDIFSTCTKASLMQHRIQNTESLVMLKLDATRNYLLGVDNFFSMLAIAISIGTFISGIFGMNLNSHLQQADGWFWGVTVTSAGIMVVLPMCGWLFFRRKGVFAWTTKSSHAIH